MVKGGSGNYLLGVGLVRASLNFASHPEDAIPIAMMRMGEWQVGMEILTGPGR